MEKSGRQKCRTYGGNDMADKIQNAYEASKNIYDDVLTQGNFFSRMYIKLFWSGTDDNAIARKVLSYIPNDFSGALLDVPVGTAVFTQRKWTALKNARITCLDYSTDMLEQAEKRLNGQAHIRCVQGDVGNLPMADESFDIVVSMNGFHAFPDKQKAFAETWRVLKPGGIFCGCFYVSGEHRRTDWFIRHVYESAKFFTPPYETMPSLRTRLQSLYETVRLGNLKSIAWFVCKKKEEVTHA